MAGETKIEGAYSAKHITVLESLDADLENIDTELNI